MNILVIDIIYKLKTTSIFGLTYTVLKNGYIQMETYKKEEVIKEYGKEEIKEIYIASSDRIDIILW